MIAKIEKMARDLRAEYGLAAERALKKIRSATLDTADFIAKSKGPVRKIADTSLKLNRISHKGMEKLVKSQVHFVEATIDDGSHRLEMAARADAQQTPVLQGPIHDVRHQLRGVAIAPDFIEATRALGWTALLRVGL